MTQGQVIDIIIMGAFSILTAYSITVFGKAHRSSEFRRKLDGCLLCCLRQEIFGGNLF